MDSVELPTPPASLDVLVGPDRIPALTTYAAFLADAGTVRGLIGPREVPRLWERHLLNCAALAAELPHGATVGDVGSGAGLPGLVLAIVRPDLQMTLIEPLLRRTTFLTEAAELLSLDNVEVVRAKADALHGARTFDVVTSRAVAPLDRLLEWSMPLVKPHGALVALKGSSLAEEIVTAGPVLDGLGCADPEIVPVGVGILTETTTVVRVAWADPSRVESSAITQVSSAPGRPGRGDVGSQAKRSASAEAGRRSGRKGRRS